MLRYLPLLALATTPVWADTSPKVRWPDPRGFTLLKTLGIPRAMLLSANGRFLVSYGGGQAEVFDVEQGRAIGAFEEHEGDIHDGRMSADGELVATAGEDGRVRIWETRTRRQRHALEAHAGFA